MSFPWFLGSRKFAYIYIYITVNIVYMSIHRRTQGGGARCVCIPLFFAPLFIFCPPPLFVLLPPCFSNPTNYYVPSGTHILPLITINWQLGTSFGEFSFHLVDSSNYLAFELC